MNPSRKKLRIFLYYNSDFSRLVVFNIIKGYRSGFHSELGHIVFITFASRMHTAHNQSNKKRSLQSVMAQFHISASRELPLKQPGEQSEESSSLKEFRPKNWCLSYRTWQILWSWSCVKVWATTLHIMGSWDKQSLEVTLDIQKNLIK